MNESAGEHARLLTVSELEAVNLTQDPTIAQLPREELQRLSRYLKEARDRARDIARQQRREIRGKSEPRGATPARDNTGTVAKEHVLAQALKRVTQRLRQRDPTESASPLQTTAVTKPSGGPPAPGTGRKTGQRSTSVKESRAKASKAPTVRMDPREVGRVSKAVKSAQARRDSKGR